MRPRPGLPQHLYERTHPGPAGATTALHPDSVDVLTLGAPDQDDPPQVDVHRWIAQLQADVAQSLSGVLLRGTRPVQLGTAAGATPQLAGAGGRLTGWSIRETANAAAIVQFYDGRDATGALVATLNLAALGSSNVSFGTSGASFVNGLYVAVTGTVEGAAHLGAAD